MATTSYEVYFARHRSAGKSGLIKIGYAANSAKRMKDLECDLLAVVPGGRNVEAFLHEKFRRDRKFGEWFAPSSELTDFIAQVKAGENPLGDVLIPAASPSKVRNVRVEDEDWERWRVLANGEPMSRWVRRVLNEAADSQEALQRRVEQERLERQKLKDTAYGHY